jgi:hypothetical protein
MRQPLKCGSNTQPSTSAANYNGLFSGHSWTATEDNVSGLVAANGIIRNFSVKLTTAPGSGKSWTFKVRKNGADTGISITISDAATTGSDTSNTLSYAPGDRLSISATPSGTPTATDLRWTAESECNDGFQLSVAYADQATRTSDECNSLHNGSQTWATIVSSNEDPRATLIPLNATVKAVYVRLTAAPGSGKSWTLTLRKNASDQASSAVTISDSATTGNVTGLNIAIAPGDYVTIKSAPTSIPAAANFQIGLLIQPNNDGESMVSGTSTSAAPADGTYNQLNSAAITWNATESTRLDLAAIIPVILKNLRIRLTSAPGASTSRTYTLRKNSSSGNNTVTLNSGDTTAVDSTHSDALSSGDDISLLHNRTGSPPSTVVNWAAILFVAPFNPQNVYTPPIALNYRILNQ